MAAHWTMRSLTEVRDKDIFSSEGVEDRDVPPAAER
jgi:hypothetical protein